MLPLNSKPFQMKAFNDLPYTRPDMNMLKIAFRESEERFEAAQSAAEQIAVIDEVQTLKSHYQTMQTLAEVRHTIDTRDSFYDKENTFFDEISPLYDEMTNRFNKKMLESRFRAELEQAFGTHIFTLTALEMKVFAPEIMEDLAEENKLVSSYSKLIASAQIDFAGDKRTLAQMLSFMEDKERTVRKQAAEAYYGFFAEHESQFDSIYDNLVKVRTRIAKKLGYKNFIQLGYDRMNRTDYNADMTAAYREQIYREIVPLAVSLYHRQAKRLGFKQMYYYDEPLKYTTGNAVPHGDPDWILGNAKKMYKELSPETDEFFTFMMSYNMLDVLAKKGKAGGGYCTTIPDYKAPFIFANFNNTQHDVEVMTHEAGHAFQAYQSRNARLLEYVWPTYEACEIHSMSMEFFTWPWMKLFFEEQTEKFQFTHLSGAIQFLPYGATVDEFQHWVYEHPEASPTERKTAWRNIEKKYLPERNYADNDFLNRGGFWMRQSHIFSTPFYYIDYTLAQVCALQFWVRSLENRTAAWEDYVRLCKTGGQYSFLRLVELAGLKNPFEDGCIAAVTPVCTQWLNKINDAAL